VADSEYDCVVVGSGPGGYVAAIRAAQLGMRTAVVEKDRIGGRCLNYACIPAKAVLRSADVIDEVRHAADFGIEVGEPAVDFAAVRARRDKVVSTLTSGVSGLLTKNGVQVIDGSGWLARPGARGVGAPPRAARTHQHATGYG
jgi:dihydrolipoamide dehydrogenase